MLVYTAEHCLWSAEVVFGVYGGEREDYGTRFGLHRAGRGQGFWKEKQVFRIALLRQLGVVQGVRIACESCDAQGTLIGCVL